VKYNWTKYGIIWKPLEVSEQTFSHATAPTPIHLRNGLIRVFYSSRDATGVGRVFSLDLDANDPTKVLGYSKAPVLDIGRPGMFDDNGVMALSVIKSTDNSLFMYYVGFEICEKIRYRLFTGLAISVDDGDSFNRFQETPILDRSQGESFFRGGAHVTLDRNVYRMYYVGGEDWIEISGKFCPNYNIRYIESLDGIHWPTNGQVILETDEYTHGYGRPWLVASDDNALDLFFSGRSRSTGKYSIGLARKTSTGDWRRVDNLSGFEIGKEFFGIESLMYTSFIRIGKKLYCFYNGDDFGKSGFALAVTHLD
jgi:hypothetical protein